MTDLISRSALLDTLRKERDDYFREHFAQDPATGTWEAGNAKEEWLEELDERIEFFENFPAVEPIATLVNNNQPGWTNIIETAPNVTIDVGTPLFMERNLSASVPGPLSKGADFVSWWSRGLLRA